MGRKPHVAFKTKAKKKKSKKDPSKVKLKKANRKEHKRLKRGINEICNSLDTVTFDDDNRPVPATSKFLNGCGLSTDKSQENRKLRKSKRKKAKRYSMLGLLKNLPNISNEEDDKGMSDSVKAAIVDQLPVKPVSSSEFFYSQRDSRKFYKKIIKKERKKQRHSKRLDQDHNC